MTTDPQLHRRITNCSLLLVDNPHTHSLPLEEDTWLGMLEKCSFILSPGRQSKGTLLTHGSCWLQDQTDHIAHPTVRRLQALQGCSGFELLTSRRGSGFQILFSSSQTALPVHQAGVSPPWRLHLSPIHLGQECKQSL